VLADLIDDNLQQFRVFIGLEEHQHICHLYQVVDILQDLTDVLQIEVHELLELRLRHQLLGLSQLEASLKERLKTDLFEIASRQVLLYHR
jgi:hypothetical protein